MESLRIEIADASQVAAARRAAVALAASAGLDETDQGRVAIIVTEAATNHLKHAGGGEILARALATSSGRPAIELLAIDRGGGLARPADAFVDGFSTSGTPGTGLGAIRRLGDAFDFHSSSRGLAIAVRVHARAGARVAPDLDSGAVCVRKPGETDCGDAWILRRSGSGWIAAVVDGLGHGPLAGTAARAALDAIDAGCDAARGAVADPEALMQRMHDALRPTRGAAAGVAAIDGGRLVFCGIGNVVCRVLHDGHERQLVTHAGIVGHEMRKRQSFDAAIGPAALVVLHSDGLTTQCAVQREAGLEHRSAAVVAGVLFRDFLRGRDDATVLVARMPHGEPR